MVYLHLATMVMLIGVLINQINICQAIQRTIDVAERLEQKLDERDTDDGKGE